jgi:hypothetical protein
MKILQSILLLTLIITLHAQSQSIIVTEINYNSDTTMNSGDWFEIYNAGTTTVNLGGWKFSDRNDNNEYIFPTGTNLQANKYLVVVNDIAKFTAMYPTVTNYIGAFSFGLSNNWDKIRLYNQAGTLMYEVTYLDSAGWPKGADGRGRTLEYKGGGLDPNLYSSWFDGCMFGSPGKAWSACNPEIVISEINYNSDTLYDCEDWFELHNETNSPIVLTGWRVSDSKDSNQYTIPVLTFPPNGYLVLARKLEKFSVIHPNVTNVIGNLGFSLANGGETIRLYNAQGKLNFSVHYRDTLGWPVEADGGGYTLELINPQGKMNEASNWKIGCFLGSPGKAFNANDCLPNSVETVYHSMLSSVQVINHNQLLVQSQSDRSVEIRLSDLTGRVWLNDSFYKTKTFQTEVPAGLYIVSIYDGYHFSHVKVLLSR